MLQLLVNCFSCKESNTLSNDMPIKQKETSPKEQNEKIEISPSVKEKPLEFHCVQNSKNELNEHNISSNATSNKSIVMIRIKENSKQDPLKAKRKILLDECF